MNENDKKLSEMIIGNSTKEIIDKLSESQKINLLAKYYGFKQLPPTIDEFIEDSYYLGNTWNNPITPNIKIYDYWREKLRILYPNPILSPYTGIVLTGALGIGKSTLSKLSAAYDLMKFTMLESPYNTFHLDLSTPFTIRCFNLTKGKAYNVLIDPLWEQLNQSPYFQEFMRDEGGLPCGIDICAARRAADVISECLIFSLVSEVNFMPYEYAEEIVDTCINRMSSRLQAVDGVFGHIILDSSADTTSSITDEFMAESPYASKSIMFRASIWEVKPHSYFKNGSFKCYAGDGNFNPHVIEDNEDTSEMDPDRIITVPNELKSNFESDIIKALNDMAGISTSAVNDFFTNRELLDSCFVLDNPFDDIYVFDFFDNELIQDRIGKYLREILPKDKKLYARCDLGVVEDKAGISISYVEDLVIKNIEGRKVKTFKIASPVNFAIGRIPGQETSIEKIALFFIWLSKVFSVAEISTDQYQSTSIRQLLTQEGIPNRLLSVDRTDTAYVNVKNLVLKQNIKFNKHPLLQHELRNLQRYGEKIDHKEGFSKDVADAMAGSIQMIIDAGLEAADPSDKQVIDEYKDSLKILAKSSRQKRMLGGISIR